MAAPTAASTETKRTPVASSEPSETVGQYRWIILVGLITAAIMEILDSTIVNVALPQMAGNLGATNKEIAWVSTGYILSNVVFLPMTAFLTARFGRRKYLSASIVIFIVASMLCGTSHSLVEIVIWRILQGMGGAALLSTSQATLRQIFSQKEQGMVQAIFILGIIVAPTLGPTLGGWITDNWTWNWCFFINLPVGLASLFIVMTLLHDPPGSERSRAAVDFIGIGLLAVGLACLQYVLEEGQEDDWFNDPMIVRLSILSAVALAVMLWWELTPRNKTPVVDFRVLRNRELSLSCGLFIALGFGLYGGVYIFPLLAQNLLGFSPTRTGLSLMPGGIGTAFTVLLCGALSTAVRVDPRVLIFAGISIFAYSMWDLGHLSLQIGETEVFRGLLIRGLGLGFLFTPINGVAFGTIDPKDAQQASSMVNLSRQLGGSFGLAFIGTYLNNQIQFHRVNLIGNIRESNPAFTLQLQGMTGNLLAHGYSQTDAKHAALGVVAESLQRQATMQAYNDCWLLVMIFFLVTSPAILLLRKPRTAAGPAAMH